LLAAAAIQIRLNAIEAFRLDLPAPPAGTRSSTRWHLSFVPWLFNRFMPFALHRVTPYSGVPAHRVTSLTMKKVLYLSGIAVLLSTTGCIFPRGDRDGWHGHGRYERHDTAVVEPRAVVMRAPELVVRPPEIIVR
jgi:hypothetical protein